MVLTLDFDFEWKFKFIIGPNYSPYLFLQWCEIWFFTLLKTHSLRVGNRGLTTIFGSKGQEVREASKKFDNEEPHDL
jgi:hypothetical protein